MHVKAKKIAFGWDAAGADDHFYDAWQYHRDRNAVLTCGSVLFL